ncbi:MAG: tripartite tricarboxylate transporter family receptor [Betaproteobacteria bacterium]|nr:tripartite tricarboxylate transporter family receptor [Betaproteobacteria bacterium]
MTAMTAASRVHRFRTRGLPLLGLLLAMVSATALAQDYPSRPVRIVVPLAVGGTSDLLVRLLAQRLTPMLGQQVIVDNRPGSGGQIGAELVARAPGDGYTLLSGTIGVHAAYAIYAKLAHDPARDLQPVIMLAEVPSVLVVHPSMPVKSVKEYIALAKARPGEITFGSAGSGSSTHMSGELFKYMAKVDVTHVPYKGSGPALSDLLGGHIQSMFENLPTLPPHIASGKLRALGITSKARVPVLPDVPTIAEAGVPGYEATAWFTIAAPSKVPAALVQKLNADFNRVLTAADTEARMRELGLTRLGGSTADAAKHFASETEKWNKVIKAAKLRVD